MKLPLLTFLSIFAFSFSAIAQAENGHGEGIELYRQGEYAKAVEALRKSVKTNKKDRLAWLYLGASLVKLNRNEDAVKAFRKSDGYQKQNPLSGETEAKFLSKPHAAFTEAAREKGTLGVVKIAVELAADGKIGFIFPIETLPDGLTESSIKAAQAIKLDTAIKNGKPVAVVKTVEYSFSAF